jgi:hypothetical protein
MSSNFGFNIKDLKRNKTQRLMAGTIKEETKWEGQRHSSPMNKKKGRKLVLLMVGGNLTHGLLMLLGCKS